MSSEVHSLEGHLSEGSLATPEQGPKMPNAFDLKSAGRSPEGGGPQGLQEPSEERPKRVDYDSKKLA